jgi:hypothetical protein
MNIRLSGTALRAAIQSLRSIFGLVSIAILQLCISTQKSYAHNYSVHQDMTNLAYEIMLVIQLESTNSERRLGLAPRGVDGTEWKLFLDAVRDAVPKLRSLDGDFGVFKNPKCPVRDPIISERWADGKKLGELRHVVTPMFVSAQDCGVRTSWVAKGGVFESMGGGTGGLSDFTGLALGAWAASIDDEIDDTHVWFRPTSVLGLGGVKAATSDAFDAGVGILLVPFVCAFDCIFNSCDNCTRRAKDLASNVNPISNLEGALPGIAIGEETSLTYVGMWHHINLRPTGTTTFDDHAGLQFERGGPNGIPDAIEIAIMAAADISGMSLRYDKSNGTRRYQIERARDGHRNTTMRNRSQWQFTTIGHVPFEPIDNLAQYGWQEFKAKPTGARNLAWPLHALGDAVVPMHVVATSGWGHRPYEDASELRWGQLIYNTGIRDSIERANQADQARRILRGAFAWRQKILSWRASVPGRGRDVPVRDLVTWLAQQTLDYVDGNGNPVTNWPFIPFTSTAYVLNESVANDQYSTEDATRRNRQLIENGAAATLGFLMSAAEIIP